MDALESIPSAQIGYTQTYCKKAVYLWSIFLAVSVQPKTRAKIVSTCFVW